MKKKIIFGAGDSGYKAYIHYGKENVIAFADNFKTGTYCNLPIWDIEHIKLNRLKYDVVVASLQYEKEIAAVLESSGISEYGIYKEGETDSIIDVQKILPFRNKHRGRRCFIIGTGPSLRMEDLELLKRHNELCIGTNKIFKAFSKIEWRPNYYFVSDAVLADQYKEEINRLDTKDKFVSDFCHSFWNSYPHSNAIKYHLAFEYYKTHMPSFSDDVTYCIYQGYTVSYESLQLAAYMGFNEIVYLGVDFNYDGDMLKGENHFIKDYFKKDEIHTRFQGDKQLLAYRRAEIYSREHGFRIFNATRGGKLEVFERVDFDKLF